MDSLSQLPAIRTHLGRDTALSSHRAADSSDRPTPPTIDIEEPEQTPTPEATARAFQLLALLGVDAHPADASVDTSPTLPLNLADTQLWPENSYCQEPPQRTFSVARYPPCIPF